MSAAQSATGPTGPVTFINRFTLHGSAADFEQAFAGTAAFLEKQPGLVQYTLLKEVDKSDSYLNVAQWEDAGALQRAVRHPDFPAHAAALRSVATSEPATFQPRLAFHAEQR